MEEIKATKPLTRAEMSGLIGRYMQGATTGVAEAKTLRERILKGEGVLALPDLTEQERSEALIKMDALKLSLREAEWRSTLSEGLAMAHGVAELVNEAATSEGWKPPTGSAVRVYMPGVCDVSVKLDGYE